jgi:hypothetical protein
VRLQLVQLGLDTVGTGVGNPETTVGMAVGTGVGGVAVNTCVGWSIELWTVKSLLSYIIYIDICIYVYKISSVLSVGWIVKTRGDVYMVLVFWNRQITVIIANERRTSRRKEPAYSVENNKILILCSSTKFITDLFDLKSKVNCLGYITY